MDYVNKVVIGSSGFVGKALLSELQNKKKAIGLDREKINELLSGRSDMRAALAGAHVFLAIGKMEGSEAEVRESNTTMTSTLVEVFNSVKIGMLTHFSTGGLDGKKLAQISGSVYLDSKSKAEKAIIEQANFPFRILRIYFPYGKNQSPNRFLPKLENAIRNSAPIKIRDDGGPFLSLTNVMDIANFSIEANRIPNHVGKIVSVSSGCNYSIAQLANLLSEKNEMTAPRFEIMEDLDDIIHPATEDFNWSELNVKDL